MPAYGRLADHPALLARLRSLTLVNAPAEIEEGAVRTMPGLESLTLEGSNFLDSLPEALGGLTALRVLRLPGCRYVIDPMKTF